MFAKKQHEQISIIALRETVKRPPGETLFWVIKNKNEI
jgi:hypothetical protein